MRILVLAWLLLPTPVEHPAAAYAGASASGEEATAVLAKNVRLQLLWFWILQPL
jgi:hypothetical protein